jgi:hypothetical protein
MQRRDPSLFTVAFAPDANELLRVTNAATASERLQMVGGLALWDEEWVRRFRLATNQPTFQAAQNELAIEGQFRPMLPAAARLGLVSDRGLAMLYELVVSMGLEPALEWAGQVLAPPGAETAAPDEARRLEQLAAAAEGPQRARLEQLRGSPAFDGVVYDLTQQAWERAS